MMQKPVAQVFWPAVILAMAAPAAHAQATRALLSTREALDMSQREESIRAALRLLPREQLDLVRLAFFEGLSHGEIAAQTGLPLGTVKSRLRLAFTRLRRALEQEGVTK